MQILNRIFKYSFKYLSLSFYFLNLRVSPHILIPEIVYNVWSDDDNTSGAVCDLLIILLSEATTVNT